MRKVNRIFRNRLDDVLRLVKRKKIILTQTIGQDILDCFVPVKHFSKSNFEKFVNEVSFPLNNLKHAQASYLTIYSSLVQNRNYVYTSQDNPLIEQFFFKMALAGNCKKGHHRHANNYLADLLSSTISGIMWRKNIDKEN